MNNLEILDIVPLDKLLPDTPDYFSYFGQAPLYSLVSITLKNQTKVGFVINKRNLQKSKMLIKKESYNLKPIKAVVSQKPLIGEKQIKFAQWLKNYYYLSLPHALYLLLQWYPKIIETDQQQIANIKEPEGKSQRSILQLKSQNFTELDQAQLKDLPALVIVPQEDYLPYLKDKFPHAVSAHLSLAPKQFSQLLQKIYSGEPVLFIGNKNSVFLPWQRLKNIIVLEEGGLFYKESFKLPYLDYLSIIEKLAEILAVPLNRVSQFPTLKHYITPAMGISASKMIKSRPEATSAVRLPKFEFQILTEQNDPEKIAAVIKNQKKVVIFSPQKILAQRIICFNCKNELSCPNCASTLGLSDDKMFCRVCFYENTIITECPTCQNNNFYLRGVGAEWLVKYLSQQGFSTILAIDHRFAQTIKSQEKFIVIGSHNLLTPQLPKLDLFIFLNFDRAFYSFDLFLKEKNLRVLEFLGRKAAKVILQTDLPPAILNKIRTGEIIADLLEERRENFLPPFSRLIKLIGRLSNLQKLNQRMIKLRQALELRRQNLDQTQTLGRVEIMGPFLKRIPKKLSRHQLELILKVSPKVNLRKLLGGIRVDEIEVDAYSMD